MHEEDIYWEYMKLVNEIFVIYPYLMKKRATIWQDIGCLEMIALAHTKKQAPSMPSSELFVNILICNCSGVAQFFLMVYAAVSKETDLTQWHSNCITG